MENVTGGVKTRAKQVSLADFIMFWEDFATNEKGEIVMENDSPVRNGKINTVEEFCEATGTTLVSAKTRASQIRTAKDEQKRFQLRNLPSASNGNVVRNQQLTSLKEVFARFNNKKDNSNTANA